MTSRLESKMTQETQVSSGPRNVITKYEEDLGSMPLYFRQPVHIYCLFPTPGPIVNSVLAGSGYQQEHGTG